MTKKTAVNKDAPVSGRSMTKKTSVLTKKNKYPKTPSTSISRSGSTEILAPQQIFDKQTNPSRPEPSSDPIHYISWNGLNEECEPLGQNCFICDEDFTCPPEDGDDYGSEEEFEDGGQPELSKLPSVDILPCGHAFHTECLKLSIPEQQFNDDPPCILCLIVD